jgi:threonine/homoserine/homoserine lactone efflux protein
VSAFFPAEENFLIATTFLTITAALVCFPSICVWAIFGNSLRLFIKDTKIKKIIEYILAILLVLTAFVILLK